MNSPSRHANRHEDDLRLLQEEVTRKQYYQRSPQRIADTLSGLMARRGYAQEQSTAARDAAWQEAVGDSLAKHSRPAALRRGVLEVTVSNSAVMQELTFRKKQLLKKLLELLPDLKARDLRFRVGVLE
jgi:predicted nucleic acid-binding Zn ribbon protein